MNRLLNSFNRLRAWCESQDFAGWDPYDGLNSRFFQALPFARRSALCRLVLIQACKRSPLNLRPLLLVPKAHNAKGVALFLQGYCLLHRMAAPGSPAETAFGKRRELEGQINRLAELLLAMQSPGYSGACWGYNFDWQARRLFLFPKNTPTVVATSFCASALIDAFETVGKAQYLDTALSSAQFVLNDLARTPVKNGFLFSYSPIPGNDTVYNASLLGSKLLAQCYSYEKSNRMLDAARASVAACCAAQADDGSWVYGGLPVQSWIDSFHTGYNLEALACYRTKTGDKTFQEHEKQGFDYYISHFFEHDGTPKYYHNRTWPIDIHCPGQLPVTLGALGKADSCRPLADKVLNWTIDRMQDKDGYFYYQLKPGISSKIPYMRWSDAFMFRALACYLANTKENHLS